MISLRYLAQSSFYTYNGDNRISIETLKINYKNFNSFALKEYVIHLEIVFPFTR